MFGQTNWVTPVPFGTQNQCVLAKPASQGSKKRAQESAQEMALARVGGIGVPCVPQTCEVGRSNLSIFRWWATSGLNVRPRKSAELNEIDQVYRASNLCGNGFWLVFSALVFLSFFLV
eukprot:SAG11_NODE_426_length_9563_cov_7.501479_10_plen_118_part_00